MVARTRYKDLQPFAMPLDGVTLIEASAGTGKTYSITSLYVRQLLERDLSVDQILVVTFTNDATEELRERIRARVMQALKFIQSDTPNDCQKEDPELATWLSQRVVSKASDENRLRAAVVSMDEAAVFTIHGFCQRMLQDNAFGTGMAFELEFIENQDQLCQQATEDFWRQWFGQPQLNEQIAAQLVADWKNPQALFKAINIGMELEDITLLPAVDKLDNLAQKIEDQLALLAPLHQKMAWAWQEEQDKVIDILKTDPGLNRGAYNSGAIQKALHAASLACEAKSAPLSVAEKFDLLTQETIEAKTKKNNKVIRNRFFRACGDFKAQLDQTNGVLSDYKIAAMYTARNTIKNYLANAKRNAGQLYFNDLLTELNNALQGEQGAALAQAIFARFPVAMIDEFQDTDAIQYRIFRSIYAQLANKVGSLYLIGDPKQAIYSFRGGDVFTYMQASEDAQRKYSLSTNWRSGSRLIHAVNTLFSAHADVFVQAAIQYQAVQPAANADAEKLTINGVEPVPLQIWKLKLTKDNSDKKNIRAGDAREQAAAHCANHIVSLLANHQDVKIGKKPLCAKDIAVLVRTHAHATLIQTSLWKKGINSVTLSDDSVFASPEAPALLSLLQCLAETNDEKLLRYVLAGRLFGMTANELKALQANESQFEQLQQRFSAYRYLWKDKGFMPAMQSLFKQEGIAGRLLKFTDGERRLTNLLQLLELGQQATKRHPGIENLLRWLADEIKLPGSGEAAKLRLESDEGLVKIVTMHSSKGLEYPVVYIPFPWHPPHIQHARNVFYHDAKQRPILYSGSDRKELALAKAHRAEETLAEDMRVLYVAMTRAARLCVISMGKINRIHSSALAWLLFPDTNGQSKLSKCTENEVFSRLQDLALAAPDAIEVCDPPDDLPAITLAGSGQHKDLEARVFGGQIEQNWWVNSYSSLTRGRSNEQPDYDAIASTDSPAARGSDELQSLPAGPAFGTFVHELLESIDFTECDETSLREQILVAASGSKDSKVDENNVEAMLKMVNNLLTSRLPGTGLCLADLKRKDRLDEMEFYFSVGQLNYRQLQQTLAAFPQWQDAVAQLNFPSFTGMMHGFIDLTFRHDGRYYLADYKSNRLDDYAPAGLDAAMGAHHYPLQALIYTLALHRYLQQRIPDYGYDQHFGGVYYLFTRGMQPGSENGVWYRRPAIELVEALDACFAGRRVA